MGHGLAMGRSWRWFQHGAMGGNSGKGGEEDEVLAGHYLLWIILPK
jgi:hypothetical protein